MKEKVELDISLSAIIKVVLVIAGIYLLTKIADILVLLFVVLVVAAAVSPIVDRLSQKMPRSLAALIIFLAVIAVFVSAIVLLIPPVISQVGDLAVALPSYLSRFSVTDDSIKSSIARKIIEELPTQLQNASQRAPQVIINFFGGFYTAFVAAFLTFYLLLEEKGIKKFFLSFVPHDSKAKTVDVFSKIGEKMGDWLRGQLLLMLIIGLISTLILIVLGVPYALALGLWAGLTEIIPYLGPILGAIPAVLLGFTVSPLAGFLVIILYMAVQQMESNFLVPKIMEKTVGLSPLIIIIALMIGGKLLGVLGVVLAVPVSAALAVVAEEWPEIRSSWQSLRRNRPKLS